MSDGRGWLDAAGDFTGAAAKGFGNAARSTVTGLGELAEAGWKVATDQAARDQAMATAKAIAKRAGEYYDDAKADPAKALRDARDGANALYTKFDEARQAAAARGKSAEFWGDAVGQGAFEVGSMLVPVGALSKAGKLGKAAKGADGLADAGKVLKAADRIEDVGKAGAKTRISVAACEEKVVAYEKLLAKGLTPAMAANREKALTSLRALGYSEEKALDALNGIDIRYPVELVDIPPPDTMTQLVGKGRPVGQWFNPDPRQSADMIGLNGDPTIRQLQEFKIPVTNPKLQALRSVAAPVRDFWTDSANVVPTSGGGVQMTVSRAVTKAITEANGAR